MLLNKETSKIKYIDFHFSESHTQFNEFIQIVDLGSIGPRGTVYSDNKYDNSIPPGRCYGLFIGEKPNLDEIIKSKINNNIDVSDKLYFDANCTYPRFKLSTKDMKRTIKLDKADKVVISKYNPIYVKPTSYRLRETKPYLAYSPSEDVYYYFSTVRSPGHDNGWPKSVSQFNQIYKKYSSTGHQIELYEILKRLSIIPNDSFVLPEDVWLLTEQDYKYIDNITNKYMQLIYDTELDKFICEGLMPVTEDDINTLHNMFSSNDNSVVGLGIKLLSSYDITSDPLSIVLLLHKHYGKIRYNDAYKSVGFKQVINSLQINEDYLGNNRDKLINQVFEVCHTDETKAKAREAVRLMVLREAQEYMNKTLNGLERYELTYDLTVN
jgi:hypothetical protein